MKLKKVSKITLAVALVIFLGIGIFLMYGYLKMDSVVSKEIEQILDEAKEVPASTFTYEMLDGLPEPVIRYFKYTLKDGQKMISLAKIKAEGKFVRPATGVECDFRTKSYFSAAKPGFIFDARMKMNTFIRADVRDKYYNEKAGMYVNILYGFNVLKLDDDNELNLTTLIRWAGEAVMFPTALLPGEHIKWEPVDENTAVAVISDGIVSGRLKFHFNEKGQIVKYESKDRYEYIDGQYEKAGSIAYRSDYQMIEGMMLPMKLRIIRILPDGIHETFWTADIKDIRFNDFTSY